MKLRVLFYLFILIINIKGAPFEDLDETVTLGLEAGYSISQKNKFDFTAYFNFYELPIKPFELEFDLSTFSIQKYHERYRLSYINLIILSLAISPGMLAGKDEGFFGFGLAGFLIALPQIATNFKLHYPVVIDHLHIYFGETTDYFIYGKNSKIYTASKIGIKTIIGPVSVDFTVNKPWLKAYLENDKLFFSLSTGFYMSRKKIEKMEKEKAKEREENGILGEEWKEKKKMTND